MSTDHTRIALATAIITMREDRNTPNHWLTVFTNIGDLLDAQGGINTVIPIFQEDERNEVPLLRVCAGDLMLLALLYVIDLHRQGHDCSLVIPYIRRGPGHSSNNKVRTAATFTLGLLGDPVAKRAREISMATLTVRSDRYDAGAIRTIFFDLVTGSQK